MVLLSAHADALICVIDERVREYIRNRMVCAIATFDVA
jgi:hypothetical protein